MRGLHLVLLFSLVACVFAAFPNPPTDEDWDKATQKAKTFVGTLNLDEKVNLATGVGWSNGPCVGNTPPLPRVNFPGFCLEDSPTGVRFTDKVSAFPSAVNTAATWNRTLIFERSAAMGQEFRGKGVHIALTPMMNIGRVAAGGRNWEGFGADPYFTGEAAYLSILGIQSAGVIANAKHYIGNEQEHFRSGGSSDIEDRTLREVYGWPFMRSVHAGVGSFMCSYNRINNSYACQNERTLNQLLKKEYGFRGYVMSDWSATMSGVASVLAGLDMSMPGDITFGSKTSYFGKNLSDAVRNGSVSESRLDDMAIRIMTPYFLLGQDKGFPAVNFDFRDRNKGSHVDVQADHAKVIRKIAADSNILLKNEKGILPFTKDIKGGTSTFALIGTDAGPSSRGLNGCEDQGCDDGTLAVGWGSGTTFFPYLVTPLEAITARAKLNGQTVASSLNDNDLNRAKQIAQQSEIAIVFGNADSGEGYITVEGNEGDRNDLNLWHRADQLIDAVASVNNKTVVVLHVVGPVLLPWINNPNIKAVILAGVPGQESGNGLADVLFGDVNPSGKLVYTLAKQRSDYPADVVYQQNQLPVVYKEKLLVDYRWFDQNKIEPVFPFGFGLSYTKFEYSGLKVEKASNNDVISNSPYLIPRKTAKESIVYKISATIANTGAVDGEEVAQLYLGFPNATGEPPKVLRGFEKLLLKKGQSAPAVFYLTDLEISIYDVDKKNWIIPTGKFDVLVGASSRDIRLTGSFTR